MSAMDAKLCKAGAPVEQLVPAAELLCLLATAGCGQRAAPAGSCWIDCLDGTDCPGFRPQRLQLPRLTKLNTELLAIGGWIVRSTNNGVVAPHLGVHRRQVLTVLDQADSGEIKLPAWLSNLREILVSENWQNSSKSLQM